MSDVVENPDHENELVSSVKENTKWLRVLAVILGEMQELDPNEIYEDLET